MWGDGWCGSMGWFLSCGFISGAGQWGTEVSIWGKRVIEMTGEIEMSGGVVWDTGGDQHFLVCFDTKQFSGGRKNILTSFSYQLVARAP